MGQSFDPYHKWLGIPPEEQPPNHYRLLGIKTFETDPDVIESAADQRMAHLRTFQAGKFGDLSQRLLNEVAAAKICLLNAAKRTTYDEQLWLRITAASPPKIETVEESAINIVTDMPLPRALRRKRRLSPGAIGVAVAVIGAAVVLGTAYWRIVLQKTIAARALKANDSQSAAETDNLPTDGVFGTGKKAAEPVARGESQRAPHVERPGEQLGNLPQRSMPPKVTTRYYPSAEPLTTETDHQSPEVKTPSDASIVGEGNVMPSRTERAAAPTAAEQEESLKAARKSHKDDLFKARTPAERTALAEKLLILASKSRAADADSLGLLCLAREVSISAANGVKAIESVSALGQRYRIDSIEMKGDAIAACVKKAHSQQEHFELGKLAMVLMNEASAAGKRQQAISMAKLAETEGRRGNNGELVRRAGESLAELQKNAKEPAAGKHKIRPVTAGKWSPLLPLGNELTGWEVGNCRFSYSDGVIELVGREMYCPIVARDATIRAQVARRTPSCVRLILRDCDRGAYFAQLTADDWSIIKMTRNAGSRMSAGIREWGNRDTLARIAVTRNYNNAAFEMTFSAIGENLTVFFNRRPVLQARDAAFTEGIVGLGADNSSGLLISDVEVLIPKKSLVADERK